MSDYIPMYEPAHRLSLPVSAAVTGGQVLVISGNRTVAPSSAASGAWIGIAAHDQATVGGLVTILRPGVHDLAASGSIAAGARVCAAAAGAVADFASGTDFSQVLGKAISPASGGRVLVLVP